VGNDRVDGTDLIDGIELGLVINGTLVGPIDIGSKGSVWLLEMKVFGVHAVGAVDGCGPTHAEDSMPTGFHN